MEFLQIDQSDTVATVTLNRPDVLNACHLAMWDELTSAFRELSYDTGVRVVVVTGAGDGFCSGADVTEAGEGGFGDPVETMRRIHDAALSLHDISKPTIAKVNGVAAGAGANLAFGCDLVVAADSARFGEVFVRRALSIDFGGSWLLPRLVGMQKAKELALFADMFSAEEAERIGLVNKVVPLDQLDEAVGEWAGRLAKGPPSALALTKRLLNVGLNRSFHEALTEEGRTQALNFGSADAREAGQAWAERREPNFGGK